MGVIEHEIFFDRVRLSLFGGHLRQAQVDGLNRFLSRWERYHVDDDRRWLAYLLGTAHQETARTMEPVEERGRGKGHDYGEPDVGTGQRYYGRGYVQLTFRRNYEKMGQLLGLDLVAKPGLALDPDVALRIIFFGMTNGTFTGKRLSDYFAGPQEQWVQARRIVNGTDRAQTVAEYAKAYRAALA